MYICREDRYITISQFAIKKRNKNGEEKKEKESCLKDKKKKSYIALQASFKKIVDKAFWSDLRRKRLDTQ